MPRKPERKARSLADLISKVHRAVRIDRCVVDEATYFVVPPRRGPDREIEPPYANHHPLQIRGSALGSDRRDAPEAHGTAAVLPEASIPLHKQYQDISAVAVE